MAEWTPTWRDRLAYRICNQVIKIASPEYRALLWLGHQEVFKMAAKGIQKSSQKLGRITPNV